MIADQREFHSYSKELIYSRSQQLLDRHKVRLKSDWSLAALRINQQLEEAKRSSDYILKLLRVHTTHQLSRVSAELNKTQRLFELYHPLRTLERGYAIVRKNGKMVGPETALNEGDELHIELDNRIIITSYIKDEKKWKDLLTKELQKS